MTALGRLTAETVEVGQRVEVVTWTDREPSPLPLDGWVIYRNEHAFTIAASPDDPGGINPDPDTYLRASFFWEDVTIHPKGGAA